MTMDYLERRNSPYFVCFVDRVVTLSCYSIRSYSIGRGGSFTDIIGKSSKNDHASVVNVGLRHTFAFIFEIL